MRGLMLEMTNPKFGLGACGVAAAVVIGSCAQVPPTRLEVFPAHSQLRIGEQIRYSVFQHLDGAPSQVEEYRLVPEDPAIVRVVNTWWLEAVSPGRTDVLVRSDGGERVLSIDVKPEARPPMPATHHTEVDRVAGKELLFVGHANMDGFDHTAVAKPGIDRLVGEFKKRGHPVVYFVSLDYPYWYTEDREPDLAIVSEGQEHEMVVDAERVVFSGGDFMTCLLRNTQMTLHGMLRAGGRDRIRYVFPADAIWAVERLTPDRFRPYPAPMALLSRLMSERSSDGDRYEQLVVPFLDELLDDFPVIGYPAVAPEPPLRELVDGWTMEVAIDNAFVQRYRSGNPDKVIRFAFLSDSAN